MNSLLEDSFRGCEDYCKVADRLYLLEESYTGRQLDPRQPLYLGLRRGMKLIMSMAYVCSSEDISLCLRCRAMGFTLDNASLW